MGVGLWAQTRATKGIAMMNNDRSRWRAYYPPSSLSRCPSLPSEIGDSTPSYFRVIPIRFMYTTHTGSTDVVIPLTSLTNVLEGVLPQDLYRAALLSTVARQDHLNKLHRIPSFRISHQ